MDDLFETHYTSDLLGGRVLAVHVESYEDPVTLSVELEPDEDDLQRWIIVRGSDVAMFPGWLIGTEVAIFARRRPRQDSFLVFDFRALAYADDLSPEQEERLWWWRSHALRALRDPGFPMTAFQEDVCQTLVTRGSPPTAKQRAILNEVVRNRRVGRRPSTLESRNRARSYAPRPDAGEPIRAGEIAEEIVAELRRESPPPDPSSN